MPDNRPIRPAPAAHAVESPPPRRQAGPADPCAMVLFGATGDLTKRLVMPALYNLSRTKLLPEKFALIGVARTKETAASWGGHLYDMLKSFVSDAAAEFDIDHIDEAVWKRLAARMSYVQGDLTTPELYEKLRGTLDEATKAHGTEGNAIFYLAVADRFFGTVVEQLGKAKLTDQSDDQIRKHRFWRRVVIEKPFGNSLDSARELNARILRTLREDQIFRIDHFLGKDTVQSIMAFRFANGLFEPIWNRDRIDHVQITVAETVGVEQRGEFYEATGALRDMVPNHLLALFRWSPWSRPWASTPLRSAQRRPMSSQQYPRSGRHGRCAASTGPARCWTRRSRPIGRSPRWRGIRTPRPMSPCGSRSTTGAGPACPSTSVPASTCRSGIRRSRSASSRHPMRRSGTRRSTALRPNWLVLRIAPDEGISLQFEVKRRGPAVDLAAVKMDFHYDDWFPKEPNVGYETLIHDVMIGDPTLFMRADMVEQGWRIVQPVLDAWAKKKADFPDYDSGSDGPKAGDELLARDGDRAWRPIGRDGGMAEGRLERRWAFSH